MKKLVLMMVIGLGAAFAAQADDMHLLYFRANAFDWSGPMLFDAASVGVAKGGDVYWNGGKTYLKIQNDAEHPTGEINDWVAADKERYNAVGWAQILEDYKADEYTFYVETYNLQEGGGGWTDPVITYSPSTAKSYNQLLQQGSIYIPGKTDPQDVKPWNVPEPTSGMLLLLGSAFLALKRKRA